MLTWIKRIFGHQRSRESADTANARAREDLNRLRKEELSVGAHFRRGIAVSSAPRQLFSTTPSDSRQATPGSRAPSEALTSDRAVTQSRSGEDFAMSVAAAQASGNVAVGYATGGSAAGALIGAALSDNDGKPE